MLEIVVATSNPHKVEEIGAALELEGLSNLRLLSLADCVAGTPGLVLHEPEEVGTTFEENATIKALSYAQQTGRVCLADDSGLEIDALGGRPGVISSHYCTDGREAGMSREERDAKNNARVMREMAGVEEARRGARFVCVMVVAGWSKNGGMGLWPVRFPRMAVRESSPDVVKQERYLPHWHRDGATYFVTWRTDQPPMDARERRVVLEACMHWHADRAVVHLACIMPDHVHLLVTPLPDGVGGWHPLSDLLRSIKTFSARTINLGRERTGEFWMQESYDRIVRDRAEFWKHWQYICFNPVKEGLAKGWREYPGLALGSEWVKRSADGPEAYTTTPPHGPEAHTTNLEFMSDVVVMHAVRGTMEGRIGIARDEKGLDVQAGGLYHRASGVPRGSNGFGYDPLFLVAAEPYRFSKTSAEMTAAEKNRLSHRGMAVREMAKFLRTMVE